MLNTTHQNFGWVAAPLYPLHHTTGYDAWRFSIKRVNNSDFYHDVECAVSNLFKKSFKKPKRWRHGFICNSSVGFSGKSWYRAYKTIRQTLSENRTIKNWKTHFVSNSWTLFLRSFYSKVNTDVRWTNSISYFSLDEFKRVSQHTIPMVGR